MCRQYLLLVQLLKLNKHTYWFSKRRAHIEILKCENKSQPFKKTIFIERQLQIIIIVPGAFVNGNKQWNKIWHTIILTESSIYVNICS